jgi:hypothetical protein
VGRRLETKRIWMLSTIPLEIILVVAYRLKMATARNARRMAGDEQVELPLRQLPIFAVDKASLEA